MNIRNVSDGVCVCVCNTEKEGEEKSYKALYPYIDKTGYRYEIKGMKTMCLHLKKVHISSTK